eukprot:TRINITY_DN4717_c0_g1_i2.p1 TRINITY_DN4717_c0_g1~~TRINITY_DN4717_c0_g1_i2.p1  ORF type:complete len:188 (-),score=23.71 TRINITY_DN4717_c0_g1_i2:99-662(-)
MGCGNSQEIEKPPEDNVPVYKLLLIGDSAVGKTCLLSRFAEKVYTEVFNPTIGVDFKVRSLTLDGTELKLQIWDTAGTERFRSVTTSYYRGAHGIILVYDITNQESFSNIQKWLQEIERFGGDSVLKLLVGNKVDLVDQRTVAYETGKALADEMNLDFLETSVKACTNVEEAFVRLARAIKRKLENP